MPRGGSSQLTVGDDGTDGDIVVGERLVGVTVGSTVGAIVVGALVGFCVGD